MQWWMITKKKKMVITTLSSPAVERRVLQVQVQVLLWLRVVSDNSTIDHRIARQERERERQGKRNLGKRNLGRTWMVLTMARWCEHASISTISPLTHSLTHDLFNGPPPSWPCTCTCTWPWLARAYHKRDGVPAPGPYEWMNWIIACRAIFNNRGNSGIRNGSCCTGVLEYWSTKPGRQVEYGYTEAGVDFISQSRVVRSSVLLWCRSGE